MNVDAILNGAAKSSKSKSKSNVPTMSTKDKKLVSAIKAFKESKKAEADAKAKNKAAAEEIVPAARGFHKKSLNGEVPTTVKIEAGDSSVQVDVAKKQYSPINMEDQPLLVQTFGKSSDMYFNRKLSISLTSAAISDKDILAKLIKAVGQENFNLYFEVKHSLEPTEAFHNARFLDDDVAAKTADLIDEGIIKPYSPAIRG